MTTKTTGDVITAAEYNSIQSFHGAKATQSATSLITSGAQDDIPFDVQEYDSDAYFTPGENKFTVPAGLAGYYRIYLQVSWAAGAELHQLYLKTAWPAGGTLYAANEQLGVAGNRSTQTISTTKHLNAGDVVAAVAVTAVNRNIDGTNGGCFFGLELLNHDEMA